MILSDLQEHTEEFSYSPIYENIFFVFQNGLGYINFVAMTGEKAGRIYSDALAKPFVLFAPVKDPSSKPEKEIIEQIFDLEEIIETTVFFNSDKYIICGYVPDNPKYLIIRNIKTKELKEIDYNLLIMDYEED